MLIDMTKLLIALRSVANALQNIRGVILWRDLNNGKWASGWEFGGVRNCFVLGIPVFDLVTGCRYFGIGVICLTTFCLRAT
jgi:hypothetical protein